MTSKRLVFWLAVALDMWLVVALVVLRLPR